MAADITSVAASATAAGTMALTMAMIGVEPQALFWAFVGAGIGLSWSAATGRARAAAVFVFVVLGAALAGTWAAQLHFAGGAIARNGLACAFAVVAHPALAAFIKQLDPLAQGLADKLGARR